MFCNKMAVVFLWLQQILCDAYHTLLFTMSCLSVEDEFPHFRRDCAAGLEILLTYCWERFKRNVVINCWQISTYHLFQNSSNKLFRDIYEKLIAPHEATFLIFDLYGLFLVCNEKKYAHFGSAYMLLIPTFRPNCSFTLIPRAYYPGMFTIATSKRSPYRGILNFK